MSKQVTKVLSKNNIPTEVKIGLNQAGFTDSDVWRATKYLYADLAGIGKFEVNTDDRFSNTLNFLLGCVNRVYGSDLKASDYDIKSGKFDRINDSNIHTQIKTAPQQNIVIPQQQVAIPQNEVFADTNKVVIPQAPQQETNALLIKYIKDAKASGLKFDEIRAKLLEIGNTNEIVNHHFGVAFPLPKI